MQAERALQASFGPIMSPPTIADSSVGTTPAALFTDSTADPKIVRRILVLNTDGTDTLSVLIGAKGTTWASSGRTVATGTKIPPGNFRTFVVSCGLSVGVVGSAAGVTYNATMTEG